MALDSICHFRRQFVYNAWANHEVLAAVRASHASGVRGLQLLAHILSAELLWLERLQQRPQSHAVWPDGGVDECDSLSVEAAELWRKYLEGLGQDDLTRTVSFQNSKRELWNSSGGM